MGSMSGQTLWSVCKQVMMDNMGRFKEYRVGELGLEVIQQAVWDKGAYPLSFPWPVDRLLGDRLTSE